MILLLDTCTFLWAADDWQRLSALARELFTDRDNEVFLSAVSSWEIAVKYSAGRLSLSSHPSRFVPANREAHGIKTLSMDEDSALHVEQLPRLHADPFDRMLVCQAIVHGMAILTPDLLIQQYAVRTVW